MTHFRKMYIVAEIIKCHIIPDVGTMYYSEGEAENYLREKLQEDDSRVFLVIPHYAIHFGEESFYLDMKKRITKKYASQ